MWLPSLQRHSMSEKQQLADEFRSVDSLRDHMIRELPWFRDCYPRLYAETNELLQAGVDLDYVSIFDIVNARNMPEERRQDLYRLWVFAAVDREIGRHERLVKRILEQKQLGGSWWRRALRHCLAHFTLPVHSMHQDDLTVDKSGACTDRTHDSFSSVSGDRS